MKQRVTIEDVAKAVGVSKQTVSRAINDKGEISSKTKERILRTIDEMGYRPSRMAQAMNTQRTLMIGCILPDITNPFFPEVVRGVQDAAREQDYSVLLCNTDMEPDQERQMLELMATQGVDGIIAFGFQNPEESLGRFADTFRPILLINSQYQHPNISHIMVPNDDGAEMVVDYFVSAGHTHIGMLTNGGHTGEEIRREIGFKRGLIKHNLPFRPDQIFGGQPQLRGGYEAAMALLKRRPEITALFTYNDLMGLGAIRAVLDLGKRVPEDVAIVGFDDIQLNEMTSPSLSSVRVDKYHLGQIAAEYVLNLIQEPDTHLSSFDIELELVHRESTRG